MEVRLTQRTHEGAFFLFARPFGRARQANGTAVAPLRLVSILSQPFGRALRSGTELHCFRSQYARPLVGGIVIGVFQLKEKPRRPWDRLGTVAAATHRPGAPGSFPLPTSD